MRALVNTGSGDLEVELREVPEPVATTSEAIVGVKAVSVNRGELRLLRARPEGWRPGQDVAGVVLQPAADGSGPRQGDRVVAWPEQEGWAEQVAVPTTHLARLDDAVGFTEAATLPVAGVTALRLLRLGGDLGGKKVLVTGASGGVGRFAVELATNDGASVTGVTASESRADGLTELGAASMIHDISSAEGEFDLILESVGGPSLEAAIRLVSPGGTIAVFGNSSDTPASISFGDFRGRPGARIEAFFVYESGEPPPFGEDLQLLADMIAAGRLHPQVGMKRSWVEASSVFHALANREVNGKAVLLIE